MEDINVITVIGNLVKDGELKYTNSGTAITNLTIAVNRSVKKGDNWEEETSFLDVSIWGRRGEALNQYLTKGTKICVTGCLKQDRWETDGQKRSRIIIVANNIQLLGGKKDQSQSGGSTNYQNNNIGNNNPNQGNFESKIPF